MVNPFGIALNPAWTEWAAKQGVSETIAAALYRLSENRKPEEVVNKLTSGELERVIEVAGHQFNCFPRGTLAAFEDSRPTSLKASARSSPPGIEPEGRYRPPPRTPHPLGQTLLIVGNASRRHPDVGEGISRA